MTKYQPTLAIVTKRIWVDKTHYIEERADDGKYFRAFDFEKCETEDFETQIEAEMWLLTR